MYFSCPFNDLNTQVTYVRNKIGSNYFIVYYKNAASFKLTPKEVGKVFGVAKFTPTVNNIRDWCKEMVDKYESSESSDENSSSTEQGPVIVDKATGFGPECHDDEIETVEINKMVL
jgi:hypothetical protein